MEGLAGTAIRPAVRVPSCPQAPVLGRAQRSASGEGLLLRVAQATTTLPATGPGTRHHARRVAASFRRQPAGTGARLSIQRIRSLPYSADHQNQQAATARTQSIASSEVLQVPACTPISRICAIGWP